MNREESNKYTFQITGSWETWDVLAAKHKNKLLKLTEGDLVFETDKIFKGEDQKQSKKIQ